MKNNKILIIQTAFLGDVILALPVAQTIKSHLPDSKVDFLCIPSTKEVLENHPDINTVIPYDKKGGDKLDKFIEVLSEIRETEYDIVISPHRYLRSALLTYYSEAKTRIGFNRNSLSFLLTGKVKYEYNTHEIYRNLELVKAIPGLKYDESKASLQPRLYPSVNDIEKVNHLFNRSNLVCFAPCSRWFTKQLPADKAKEIVHGVIMKGYNAVLIGGKDDMNYCSELEKSVNDNSLVNICGKTTALQSYEVINRSKVLITADSGAQHLGAASQTPVALIYGSTDRRFGFYPLSKDSIIIENNSLTCRPCTDHGRDKCPKKHFKCMTELKAGDIVNLAEGIMKKQL